MSPSLITGCQNSHASNTYFQNAGQISTHACHFSSHKTINIPREPTCYENQQVGLRLCGILSWVCFYGNILADVRRVDNLIAWCLLPRICIFITLSAGGGYLSLRKSLGQAYFRFCSLQWRHNERDGISNHQPHDCLFNGLFRCRSKKTPKFCVTGLFSGNSPGTGEFPAQMASNAENITIWWRHHVTARFYL